MKVITLTDKESELLVAASARGDVDWVVGDAEESPYVSDSRAVGDDGYDL